MHNELMKLPAEQLLNKFGIGSHVPGSGSAAAFQGMLSAKLILTVIHLTSDERRSNSYHAILPDLSRMTTDIDTRIYPVLEKLFQQDSEQFNYAIELRKARDKEKGLLKGRVLDQQSKEALMSATETLIDIARLCVELADFSKFIFDNGFKSARGDSCVALNSAVAAVSGSISIINLNLLSIDNGDWLNRVNSALLHIKSEKDRLQVLASDCQLALEKEAATFQAFQAEIQAFQRDKITNENITNSQIEALAKKVQNILWNHRETVWKKATPESPREVLQARIAFEKILKYKVIERERLEPYELFGEKAETAGIIDNNTKLVGISKAYPFHIRNFTLAHELGHALLHRQAVLHRDRPLDGSGANFPREAIELQADKFATYFLMPKKQVEGLFEELFSMKRFVMNDDTVFSLTGGGIDSFRLKCRNQREFSRIIASAVSFQGEPFRSIASVFNVSVEAMAIRLEELQLVEYESSITSLSPLQRIS